MNAALKQENSRRVKQALRAVHTYKRRGEPVYDEDVIDLLADLRHFCHATGLDFTDLNRVANNHFLHETR